MADYRSHSQNGNHWGRIGRVEEAAGAKPYLACFQGLWVTQRVHFVYFVEPGAELPVGPDFGPVEDSMTEEARTAWSAWMQCDDSRIRFVSNDFWGWVTQRVNFFAFNGRAGLTKDFGTHQGQ
jgi:hypothetical protein